LCAHRCGMVGTNSVVKERSEDPSSTP
jgi:hypothetical protein